MADNTGCNTCAAKAAQSLMGRLARALSPDGNSSQPPPTAFVPVPPEGATVIEIPGDPNAKLEVDRMPRRTFSW